MYLENINGAIGKITSSVRGLYQMIEGMYDKLTDALGNGVDLDRSNGYALPWEDGNDEYG